jgi:syntaxin 1B/2/3
VKPDATPEEIDDVMADGTANAIFTQELLADRSTQAAKNALADIQDKHKDIMRLEQSIVELHQLFVDMSVLVETQGEMLDQIEYSVQQAHAYVGKGVQQLEKAKQYQKNSRQRMCCIMCCLVVGLMVVVGTVFGGLLGAKVI